MTDTPPPVKHSSTPRFDNPAVDHDDQMFLAEMLGSLATGPSVPDADQRAVLEPLISSMVDKAVEVQTVHFAAASTADEMLELANALKYFMQMVTAYVVHTLH